MKKSDMEELQKNNAEKTVSVKLFIKSSFWYTAASFFSRAMVFITMPLFTRLLTNREYGDFSVYATWQTTLLIVCGLEVYSTINRARFDFDKPGELDGYISSALVLSTLFTSIIFVLYLVFPNMFDRLFLLDEKYMMIMFAYLFTYPAFAMFHTRKKIEYKYKTSTILLFATLAVSYITTLVLTLNVKTDRLFGRIFGQFIWYIVLGLFYYVYFLRRSHAITLRAWKYALRIGLPLVFAYLSSQVLLASDNIVVKHLCSGGEVSYLSVTHSCSHIVLLLVQAVNTSWAPWFYDMLKAEKHGTIRKTYLTYLWFVVFCTFAVALIGPEIIMVAGGEKYSEAVYLLPAYTLCGVFTVLNAQFSNLETYYKKTEYAAIFTAIAAALNLALDIVGIKIWGYQAVCYATVFCQLALIALHYCFTIKLGIKEFLPVGSVLAVLAVSLAIIPGALFLYQSNIVRYVFIVAIAVIGGVGIIVKRKDIIEIIIRIKSMT